MGDDAEKGRITYLLIEDDESQATLLAKWIKKVVGPVPTTILFANNLEDGIKISNDERPGTTFLDLFIPLIPGGQTVTDWKQVADGIPLMVPPVIAVTGMDVTADIKHYCMTLRGAHHVFHKPYNDAFFDKLRGNVKIFAARLVAAAGDAEFRAPASA